MVLFPNAKINIGLNILRKREDGYHDIETLFYPIGLKDALEYVVNGKNKVNFYSSGLNLNIEPEQNIILKVYRMLQNEHDLPGLDIHLHKVIPSGAGLGGGSADAAFFLKSLTEHFELNISQEKLKSIAGKLGADCAFFLQNSPSYALGVGEQLSTVELSLKGYSLLLVKPPFGIDTKLAYLGVVPQEFPFNFKDLIQGEINKWSGSVKNDFETTLFLKFPELARLKHKISELGPVYTSMSGSGSSVYGVFKEKPSFDPNTFPVGSFIWQEELN